MKPRRAIVASVIVLVVTAPAARAQKACEYLVPPHGGAYEVPVHPAYVTSLRFAGKIASASMIRNSRSRSSRYATMMKLPPGPPVFG